ncbi:MAG: DUF4406 domain-containing protein [Christensenellaceae bacterium]
MNKIFICSALRGDVEENIKKAKEYCRWAALECGAIPIAPHIYFTQFLDDNDDSQRQLGIDMGIDLLKDCSELLYFGDFVTQGMVSEITKAYELKIPVRHVPSSEIMDLQNENGGLIYE